MDGGKSTQTPKYKAGRKIFDGKPEKEILSKLEEAFSVDCNITEACSYANISRTAFYRYLHKHPEFRNKIEQCRNLVVFKARVEVVKGLEGDPEFSLKFLERFKKDEFALR